MPTKLYAMIGIGIVVAAFLFWVWRIDSLRALHLKEVQAAELKLTISNTSLNLCTGQIADNNRRISEANKRLETDKQQAAANLARANARWERSRATVSALEGSARATGQPPCALSENAREALGGL